MRGRTINTGDGEKKERKRREKKTLILLRLSDPLKGIASRNNEDATFDWLPFRVASIADCSDCSLAHARDCALSPLLSVCERACTCEGKSSWREGGRVKIALVLYGSLSPSRSNVRAEFACAATKQLRRL